MKIYHNEKDEDEASKEGPSYFLETKRKISIKSDIQSPNLSICFVFGKCTFVSFGAQVIKLRVNLRFEICISGNRFSKGTLR